MNKILVDLKLIGSNTRPVVVKRKVKLGCSRELNLQLTFDIPQDIANENKNEE